MSAPSTIIDLSLSPRLKVDTRRTWLAWGGATLLSSHAGTSPTGDERHSESQSGPTADSVKASQLAAGRSLPSKPDVTPNPNSKHESGAAARHVLRPRAERTTMHSHTAFAARPGEHACCRFASAEDRRLLTVALVRDAMRRNYKVLYLCPEDVEAAVTALARLDARV